MCNILQRRQTHFVLWCPRTLTNAPELLLGQIKNGNPPAFIQLQKVQLQPVADKQGLWEVDAQLLNLTDGQIYHYWYELDMDAAGTSRIQVTDPLAFCIDYRLYAPLNPTIQHPAAVIGWFNGQFAICDPNGEKAFKKEIAFDKLPTNNQLVIYELPTAWVSTSGFDEFERAVGTFRDVRALVDSKAEGANFTELAVTDRGRKYMGELGVNALEILPPADSIYSRQWGYGSSHYLAPDYELGYPEGYLSPTANQDLCALIDCCHENGIRVFLDVVLGFMKDEPYREIDIENFYLEDPNKHKDDDDAYSSRRDDQGRKVLRSSFGASSPRYIKTVNTYDPISGDVKNISPIRQHMLTFLAHWMNQFLIDGIRMDSVETVANWEFIEQFKKAAYEHFQNRYAGVSNTEDKFLVVGEELTLPKELLTQNRLDGLWNEHFQTYLRAAILGENAQSLNEPSFEWTVKHAIDCRLDGFTKGTQAINYITSHDVEGDRKERLYNLLKKVITAQNSGFMFNRSDIEQEIRTQWTNEEREFNQNDIDNAVDGKIVHLACLRRIKLAFICQLTAVGIPMILAGEEFGDEHDLFNAAGAVTHEGGKQVDPVNYSRLEQDEDRRKLLAFVSRLVKLRTEHPALMSDDVHFIHVDFNEGKRVLAWKRGTDDPVVVVANFSDYGTPFPFSPNAEYIVPDWPTTPDGMRWFEVSQEYFPVVDHHDKEAIFPWEGKVYRLVPTE